MTNDVREMKARIIVFGVGGAGGNAVNNMIAAGLQGVDFIVAKPLRILVALARSLYLDRAQVVRTAGGH
jgi:cell division protein FtsZ